MLWRIGLHLICALALAATAYAQPSPAPPKPPAVVPPPPPIPDFASEPGLEPQVTIIRRETETVEEVRVNGELRYIKVTPKVGLPYYLVPRGNGQAYLRYDSLDTGLRTPMWLLFSW